MSLSGKAQGGGFSVKIAIYQYTVKPVYNDHLYYKIYYLWLIQ